MSDGDSNALYELLGYHRQRYWLSNGWCMRFRVKQVAPSIGMPNGFKYAFNLHDVDMRRLMGFDNAHGIPKHATYDHMHRFRNTSEMVPYDYIDAGTLIADFFSEVEKIFEREGYQYSYDDPELEEDDDDEILE